MRARSANAARKRDLMGAVTGQRRRHRVLHRSRTAQAAVGEFLHRCQCIVEPRTSPDDEPAGPPAWCEIRLRETREGNDRRVGIEGTHEGDGTVVAQISIDLVRQNRKVVSFGEFDQRSSDRRRVHRAGRIVRIDHDKHPRPWRDKGSQVIEVWQPVVLRIGSVVPEVGRRFSPSPRCRADRSARERAPRPPHRRAH